VLTGPNKPTFNNRHIKIRLSNTTQYVIRMDWVTSRVLTKLFILVQYQVLPMQVVGSRLASRLSCRMLTLRWILRQVRWFS